MGRKGTLFSRGCTGHGLLIASMHACTGQRGKGMWQRTNHPLGSEEVEGNVVHPGRQDDGISAEGALDAVQRKEVGELEGGVLLQEDGDEEEGVERREGKRGEGGESLRDLPPAGGVLQF